MDFFSPSMITSTIPLFITNLLFNSVIVLFNIFANFILSSLLSIWRISSIIFSPIANLGSRKISTSIFSYSFICVVICCATTNLSSRWEINASAVVSAALASASRALLTNSSLVFSGTSDSDCSNFCANDSWFSIPAAAIKAAAAILAGIFGCFLCSTNAFVFTGTADFDAASTDSTASEAFGVVPPCCPRFILNCFSKKSSNSDSFPPPCWDLSTLWPNTYLSNSYWPPEATPQRISPAHFASSSTMTYLSLNKWSHTS